MEKNFAPKAMKKVTDQYLRHVLVTSICGILLCMSCLAGTTWAWFTVSIENTGNVIDIAEKPSDVIVTVDGSPLAVSPPNLSAGTNTLQIAHSSEADDVQQKSKLYVTFLVNEAVKGYVTLNAENNYAATVEIIAEEDCFVSWTVSWFAPDGADPLVGNTIDLRTAAQPAGEDTDSETDHPVDETESALPEESVEALPNA